MVLDSNGSLIDSYNLNLTSMNSKGSSHAVSEFGGTSISIESSQSPFDSHVSQDGISRFDFKCAVRSDVHIQVVLNSNKSVFSTSFIFSKYCRFSYSCIPSVNLYYLSIDVDFVGSTLRVLNSEFDTSSSHAFTEVEPLFTRGSTSVFNGVFLVSLDLSDESSSSLLTSVDTVPTVIHIVVEFVRKSCVVVLDVDWLHRAVHSVGIKRVNQELSYLSVLTEVSVPGVLLFTCITGDTLVVTYDLEDCIRERRLGSSRKGGAFELEHCVLRGSAREVTTISRVGPFTRRLVDMGYSAFMHIIEDSVFEVLDVDVVRSVSVGTHAVLPR